MGLFGKKKREDDFGDIPDLPPLDLDQIPGGPPVRGAPQRFARAEQAGLQPAGPQLPPAAPLPPPPQAQDYFTDTSQDMYSSSQPYPAPAPLSFAEAPAPPAPEAAGKDHVTLMTEDIEKIAEDIVDEKWTKLVGELNEIKNWKEAINEQVKEVKDAVSKLDSKLGDVQKAILGKVGEYNSSLKDVNVELKAMSKVFEKILPTFTDNIKKLSSITTKVKKK